MIRILLVVLCAIGLVPCFGQNQYVVYFADKAGVCFDPHDYFDPKAIARRQKHDLPINDESDWPVNATYVEQIAKNVSKVQLVSRWFNAVFCEATETQIQKLEALDFVRTIEQRVVSEPTLAAFAVDTVFEARMELLKSQSERMGASVFRAKGIAGEGIRIAVFDAGFPDVDRLGAFSHLRDNQQIIDTWDFVKQTDLVYHANTHGTSVLSCIAGIAFDTAHMGLAPQAEFLLARTESWRENVREELNWLAAAEWADQNGADIISSSLGYTAKRYFREDMDGRSSFVSRAATWAAKKGILVINAAGNDGETRWKRIVAPADADSVLTVGGIDPSLGYHADFSSFGPTADLRLKPNVVAFSHTVVASAKGYREVDGTSFATPLVAGFAACVMQMHPEWTNMEVFRAIEASADLHPYADYAHGYGVPQADYIVNGPCAIDTTFTFAIDSGGLYIHVRDFDAHDKTSEEWSKRRNNSVESTPFLYYQQMNTTGFIEHYRLLSGAWEKKPNGKGHRLYRREDLKPDHSVRVHYMGYTAEFKID